MQTDNPPTQPTPTAILQIPVERLVPDSRAARRYLRERPLQNLTNDIAARGVLHPLTVLPFKDNFIIVDGERRRRAAQRLNLPILPCIVLEHEPADQRGAQMSATILRERLCPVEKSLAIRKIHDAIQAQDPSVGWKEVVLRVGLERTRTIHLRQLSTLPEPILNMLRQGLLSAEHGAELARLREHPQEQLDLADAACRQPGRLRYGLTRRILRQRVAAILGSKQSGVSVSKAHGGTGGDSCGEPIIRQSRYDIDLMEACSSFRNALTTVPAGSIQPCLRSILSDILRESNYVLGLDKSGGR